MSEVDPDSAQHLKAQFVELIEGITGQMRDFSRSTILDAARHASPRKVERARELVALVSGNWVDGTIEGNSYFVWNWDTEAYGQEIMTGTKSRTHEFGAVLLGLASIEVELPNYSSFSSSKTQRGEVLCLELGHLGGLAGIDEAVHSNEPAWLRLKNQPFGRPEHARKPLWVPISYLQEGSLAFVDWEQSSRPLQGENPS
jgi:hypothetical protein